MKNFLNSDPIAALATPKGRSAVAIIRLSGNGLWNLLTPLLLGKNRIPNIPPPARTLCLMEFMGAADQPLDQVLVVHFPQPNSFTGEDLVEIQCHGSPVIIEKILERLFDHGFRPAQPGEFSLRAFTHKKMDLAQAEALIHLINATSLRAAKEAKKQMEGNLSQKMFEVKDILRESLAHLEAELDFPEEDVDTFDSGVFLSRISRATEKLAELLRGNQLGKIWTEGIELAIVGKPNVGKSTLFNTLIEKQRAIVTDIPGTTRDFIEEQWIIDGLSIQLIDTAGLRETEDVVEEEGVRLTKNRIQKADLAILVLDCKDGIQEEDRNIFPLLLPEKTIIVWNKCDIRQPDDTDRAGMGAFAATPQLIVSAKTGMGIAEIAKIIAQKSLTEDCAGEGPIIMVARQRNALKKAVRLLVETEAGFIHNAPYEITAHLIGEVLKIIGEFVGEVTNEDVLDDIFSAFCIGK